MKDRSRANRGMQFETLLNMACDRYRIYGEAIVHKIPTEFIPLRDQYGKVHGCKVEHKSCVDYLGRYGGIPVAVEAKNTMNRRIEYTAVQPHQAEFLDQWCRDQSSVGIVVVSFSMDRFFAVPWYFWQEARNEWINGTKEKKKLSRYGWTWTTNGMASVNADELLPEWEIKQKGSLILPFLENTKRMAM